MKRIVILLSVLFGAVNLYSQNITVDTAGIYKINALYQTPPQFPVDMNTWIDNNIGSNGQEEGEVHVSFVIEKDGTVSTIRLLNGVPEGSNMGGAALQIVRAMPRWKPATQNGKPVAVNYSLGFIFKH